MKYFLSVSQVKACTLMAVLLGAICSFVVSAEEQAPIPLGVYWPGEWTFRDLAIPKLRWEKIDAVLDQLAKKNVNTVWLTHVDAKEGAEFARHAGVRGIRLVASLGELTGEQESVRKADPAALSSAVIKGWGDAPKPLAWGLGDEPRASYVHEITPLAEAFRKMGQPATTVIMAGDIPAAVQVPYSYLCTDIYPFFSAGNPNGPGNIAESSSYLVDNMKRLSGLCAERKMTPWFMGAGFQEIWGPAELDKDGNFVVLPGGNAHFKMPTPAEMRWQLWAAAGSGAKGFFIFSLFFNITVSPKAQPLDRADQPPALKEKTNTGAPGGLMYPDGKPTAQFDAMGEAYGRLAKVAPVLSNLKPGKTLSAFHSKGCPRTGDLVFPLQGNDGEEYAVVVSGDLAADAEVPVNVQAAVTSVTDVVTGKSIPLIDKELFSFEPIGKPFKQVRVKLKPGDGTLLLLKR